MVFPRTPLPLRVHIAPGGNPGGDPATWTWVEITSDVRVASGVTISVGKSDEGARVDPGSCALTLDNRSGDYSTRNVNGAYYGQLAKGTPLRVGTDAVVDAFGRTVSNGWGTADSGQSWTMSGSIWSVSPSGGAQLSFAAANTAFAGTAAAAELLDIDAQFTCSVPAVMTGASQIVALLLRYLDGNNFYMASCEFNPSGTVTAKVRSNVAGSLTELATTGNIAGLSYIANQKLRVHVQADGPALRVMIWQDGGTPPTSWNLNITDTSLTKAGVVGIYEACVSGNTNTKPYTVTVDDLEVEAIEFTGAVYEWPPRWDQSRKDATAPITASGILRRLQQGKSPLRSPITRMMLRQSPVELWPFEDDSSATVAASALAGGTPAAVNNVQFAQTDAPVLPGAKQTMGVTASTLASFKVRTHTATGTWAVVWFDQLLAAPAATTVIMSVTTSGTVRRWDITLDSLNMNLLGYDSSGTQVYNQGAGYGAIAKPPLWIAFDLLVKQSGGNVDAKLLIYGVDPNNLDTAAFFGTTIAGTVGSPTGGSFQGSLGFNGGRQGPLMVCNFEPQFVGGEFTIAANGYLNELAADRVDRLCAEEGIQVVVEAGDSEPMGAQTTDTVLNLLYACEDTDQGILYERGAGLAYRPRGARYNRPVELALDFAVGDIAAPPEPTDDDQNLKNQWTVSRDGGSSAVAQDQDSIDASGLLDDSITVNVAGDSVLPNHAGWRLATTTVDELRWPSIALNLARNTGQIRLWRAAQPFPRVTIANEPAEVAGNAVDVTVLGYGAVLDPFGWDIDLNCAPSAPWSDAGVYGTTRGGSSSTVTGSTLAATTGTGVSLTLTYTTPADRWSTTVSGYQIKLGGEVMTVTGMGSPSGTSPTISQVATVTRAVNGYPLAHGLGEPVQVYRPDLYAL